MGCIKNIPTNTNCCALELVRGTQNKPLVSGQCATISVLPGSTVHFTNFGKSLIMFKSSLLAGILLALSIPVQAQSVVDVTSESCNVANTFCTFQGSDGNVYIINPQTRNLSQGTLNYIPTASSCTQTINTLYRYECDFVFTYTPTAVLTGTYIRARSGSGRGGYQWHTHYIFDTLTIY